MSHKVIFSGSGGQGILLIGNLLAHTAMEEGKFITWMPSYGVEQRGGPAHCMVQLSNEPINSPIIFNADGIACLDKLNMELFIPNLKPNGTFIMNSSLVKSDNLKTDIEIIKIPASSIAKDMGNIKVTNMIMLGAYLQKTKIVPLENLIKAISKVIPASKKDMIELDEKAIRQGAEYIVNNENKTK